MLKREKDEMLKALREISDFQHFSISAFSPQMEPDAAQGAGVEEQEAEVAGGWRVEAAGFGVTRYG